MITLILSPAQIITVDTNKENIKHGSRLGEIHPLYEHSILIEDGIIKDFIPFSSKRPINHDILLDVSGKTVLPGLIDCHTHTIFAGSRANEFREKINGASYEEIASKGGGINFTVDAVRKSSIADLTAAAEKRVRHFISQGVTTLEIKSGYGLNLEDEVKILNVISKLKSILPIDIIPTFLGAHTIPMEFRNNRDGYLDLLINKIIPYVSRNNLAKFCDGFCESSAFSASELDKIFFAARKEGLLIKIHTDQFNSIGGIDLAKKYNAVSVDHLEAIQRKDIKKIGDSNSVCVLLPGVSYFLNYNYAPARELIEENAAIALSTDYNPGSSNISSVGLIMSLAALKMRMTIEEIISAYTINAAAALGLGKSRGSIEIGKAADLSIFDTGDYSDLVYKIGENLNCVTIKNGEVIYKSIS